MPQALKIYANNLITRNYLKFLLTASINLILLSFIIRGIFPIHYLTPPLFFSDLMSSPFRISAWTIYLFGLLNLYLVWAIGKELMNEKFGLLGALTLGSLPWFLYGVVSGSFYIYLLCLVLLNIFSLVKIKSGSTKFSKWLFIISVVCLAYSFLLMFLIYPLFIVGIWFTDRELFRKIKVTAVLLLVLIIPLVALILNNRAGVINIYHQQVNFLSDPGLINAVNLRRGEGQAVGLGTLVKVFENKYLYLSSYIALKFLSNLSLPNYFTMNTPLLGFSFSPPLFVGFIIPFVYGLIVLFGSFNLRKYSLLSIVLTLPSLFSAKLVDIDRLLIFLPFFIFTITFGLVKILEEKRYRVILIISVLLILIQLISTLFDINQREFARFRRVNGEINLQLKQ